MTLKKVITTSVTTFILIGCGGGGNSGSTNNNSNSNTPPAQNKKLTSGKVSDGYIAGANVLVDINTTTKGAYDSGDINTTTNASGDFNIPSTLSVPKETIVYATGGKIVSTGQDFNGTLKGVFDGEKNSIVLSPITTMVATLVAKGNTPKQAKEKVATALNIPTNKVDADPVTDIDALKGVQKVVAIAKVLQADSNNSVSNIIDNIATHLNSDSNLTQAVEKTTQDANLSKAAIETAKTVEEAIGNLHKDANSTSSNGDIEQAVQKHIVDKAKEAVKHGENVTEVLKTAKTNLENDSFKNVIKAATCLNFATIKAKNSSVNSVTGNLNLSAKNNCKTGNLTISWVRGSKNVDLKTGAVTRANYDNKLSFVEANITDGNMSQIKPIYFTVLAKGQRPVAKPDMATVQVNGNVTIDILANDTDDNKNELNVTIVNNPKNGKATLTNHKIVYTPNTDFSGTDSLTYSLKDPYGAESNTTVKIIVATTKISEAIGQIQSFDKDNGNFNALLSNLKTTLQKGADENQTDAKVGLAVVNLAQTLNDEVGNLIDVDGTTASIDTILHKKDGDKITLAAIDNLSEQTEDSLSKIATNLKDIANSIDTLLASNPNYTFRYKNFTLSRDDLKALSGALDLKAAILEYGAAYNPVKKEYLETKTAKINGTSVEYRIIKADPVKVLNDSQTLSLNGNAQTHFNNSKSELQKAINKLALVNTNNVKEKFRKNLSDIKGKLADINASLNGGSNFVSKNRENKTYINVSALFDESTAPTLSSILGNNWKYRTDEHNATYNSNLSIKYNKPMGIAKTNNGNFPVDLEPQPSTIPTGNSNRLTKIVTKIVDGNNTYTGNQILKKAFGEPNIIESQYIYNYKSLSDVNITYTIKAGATGDTGPYSCKIENLEFWDNNWNNLTVDNGFVTTSITEGNKCKLKFNPAFAPAILGTVYYDITIKDSYGHEDFTGREFTFGNQNGGGQGGDNGDQNGTNGGSQGGNNDSNHIYIGFTQDIDANTYNDGQAINIPDFPLYRVKYRHDNNDTVFKISTLDRNTTHITYSKVVNGDSQEGASAKYSVNNNIMSLFKNNPNDSFLKIKFIQKLNYTELNKQLGKDIFSTGDIGYATYFHHINDGNTDEEYELQVWLNESAKNHFETYIQDNFSN